MSEKKKYRHIIFDFGNVLGKFDETYILSQFCKDPADFPILKNAVYAHWQALDEGSITYDEALADALSAVPDRLKSTVTDYFENWYRFLTPILPVWELVRELKEKGYNIYILSNASVQFAEKSSFYEITKEFDGIVFSAVIKMAKPAEGIYNYLFRTFGLHPEDCFFLDDKPENIRAGQKLGMDGLVFTGDVEASKKAIGIL